MNTPKIGTPTVIVTARPMMANGKRQVHVTDKPGGSIVVNSKKSMNISKNFDRFLTQASPAGCLPLVGHELTHVLQAEANTQLAEQLSKTKWTSYYFYGIMEVLWQ